MFAVPILQRATIEPPNIITHKKGFTFHAQPQTGAYSCWCSQWCPQGNFLKVKLDKEFLNSLFYISTSWFSACVFCETVTTFVVSSVRVATLTELTVNDLSCFTSHLNFGPIEYQVRKDMFSKDFCIRLYH